MILCYSRGPPDEFVLSSERTNMLKYNFICLAVIFGGIFAMPNLSDFENKFNILVDPALKETAANNLAKAEAQIKEQHDKYVNGEANFGSYKYQK